MEQRAERPTTAPMGLGYRPQLDGVRALAILSVVVFHAFDVPVGGYLGVDIFFVLSGFLITTILAGEHLRTGRIAILAFYRRRAVRLFPALLVMLAVFTFVAMLLDNPRDRHTNLTGVTAALTYSYDFVAAAHTIQLPAALGHLWSLAIEEQFYLVWPFVLALLMTRLPRRAVWIVVELCVAAMVYRLVAADLSWAFPRIYLSPDTRCDGLLLGSALGLLWAHGTLPRALRSPLVRRAALFATGSAAVAMIATVSIEGDETHWAAAMIVVNVATGLLLLEVLLAERGPLARLLSFGPFVYVGRLSYSLYLWHLPILVLFGGVPIALGLWDGTAALALTALVSAASYHLVERRFMLRLGNERRGTAPSGAPA